MVKSNPKSARAARDDSWTGDVCNADSVDEFKLIHLNISGAVPFETITTWCKGKETPWYRFVPRYTDKKKQKKYEKWLKTHS